MHGLKAIVEGIPSVLGAPKQKVLVMGYRAFVANAVAFAMLNAFGKEINRLKIFAGRDFQRLRHIAFDAFTQMNQHEPA